MQTLRACLLQTREPRAATVFIFRETLPISHTKSIIITSQRVPLWHSELRFGESHSSIWCFLDLMPGNFLCRLLSLYAQESDTMPHQPSLARA